VEIGGGMHANFRTNADFSSEGEDRLAV
jgi:hypothetical protein